MSTICFVRDRCALAEVAVTDFDSAMETWPLYYLDQDERIAWILPDGVKSVDDCIQCEYDPAEDEERVRFVRPVTWFSIRLVRMNDINPIEMMYYNYREEKKVEFTTQHVFSECLPVLRQMAIKDIQEERRINTIEGAEYPYYCNTARFLAVFEVATWRVTPKWAKDDPDTEWMTTPVCSFLSVLGRLDSRFLSNAILPPDGEPGFRHWEVNKVGLFAEHKIED